MTLKDTWEKFGDLLGNTPLHPQFFAKRYATKVRQIAIERATGTVADVGSGRAPYRTAMKARSSVTKYLTIDHPEATELYSKDYPLDIAADITKKIPLANHSVDTILLLMVLEHVPNPASALTELYRMMKPGGELILSTIMTHPVHDPPFDFYRYTRFGLESLLIGAGFELVELGWEGSSVETAVTTLNTTLFQHLKHLTSTQRLLPLALILALILALVGWPIAIVLNLIAIILAPLDRMHHFPHTVWAVARRPESSKGRQHG